MTSKLSFLYPKMISNIENACHLHIKGEITADQLNTVICSGMLQITAIEEKDIYNFLGNMDGRLEEIKFLVAEEQQLLETQKIAANVLFWLEKRGKYSCIPEIKK